MPADPEGVAKALVTFHNHLIANLDLQKGPHLEGLAAKLTERYLDDLLHESKQSMAGFVHPTDAGGK